MKKISLLFTTCFIFLISFNANSQASSGDYFVGKWNVEIKGTPQGDAKMLMTLERKDGKLTGYQFAKEKPDTVRFEKIEEKEKSISVYYTAQGYNITMTIGKKDDDHVAGSLMDMFDVSGERVKDAAKK